MKIECKLGRTGNSLTVVIPKAILTALGKKQGDTIKLEIKEEDNKWI